MSDTQVENFAKKILAETSIPEEEEFGSIIALLMIISLCFTAIRIVQECKKNNSSTEDIQNDIIKFSQEGILAKWRLRREMRKSMSKEQYKKYRSELESALVNVGSNISYSETEALLEARND